MATAIVRRRMPVLLGANGRPLREGAPAVRARYDAAQTTTDNRRYWANADSLSAEASNDPAVRRTLRNRARYEVANNSFCKGICLTKVNFCVGTGPTLQVLTEDKGVNDAVEKAFRDWTESIDFASKLRTIVMARTVDGESFGVFTGNPKIDNPVELDIALVEADRVTDSYMWTLPTRNNDGIFYDAKGNPLTYKVLRYHPGDTYRDASAYDRYEAYQIVHTFRRDRPGQRRGVPEITPALPLFAQLRQYGQAVIDAARMAASMSGWLYTDQSPDDSSEGDDPAFDVVEHERNTWQVAPAGYQAKQLEAEQPTTTHAEFVKTTLSEIARCLNMPYNIAAGNSGDSNMASARLDCQIFYVSLDVDRHDIALHVCEPTFRSWLREAALIPGLLPDSIDGDARIPHRWNWPGYPQADPEKEANALKTLYEIGGDTLTNWYARDGRDGSAELAVWKRERALTHPEGRKPTNDAPPQKPEPKPQEQPQ